LFEKPPEEFLEHNTEGIDWERVADTVGTSFPFECENAILNGLSLLKMTSRNRAHGGRTAKECEIKWLGDRHPSINHAQWSQPETNKCRDLVDAYRAEHGHGVTVDWVWIAKELKVTSGTRKPLQIRNWGLFTTVQTNRSPLDCMRHGTVRKTHVWTPESDNALLEAINVYGLNNWLLGIFRVEG